MARILTFALLALGLFACGGPQEYVLTGTSRSPGSDGMMIVEDTGGNHMITVELEHLPPPQRFSQGKHYVVWIKPNNGVPQMAGQLDYDPDERVGRMTATTPVSRFELLVTVERALNVSSPSEIIIAKKRTGASGS